MPTVCHKNVRRLDDKKWLDSMNYLVQLGLSGLEVSCPECGRMGVPGPKWVNGPKIKPVYIFHRQSEEDHTGAEMCLIKESQVQEIRKVVRLKDRDIVKLASGARTFVLFSGGRDSLCALDYISTIARKSGSEVEALHVDTTAGMPQVANYVKEVCDRMNVRLQVVKPRVDYFTLAKEWGIPSNNSRWCCRELKIRPIVDFLDEVDDPKVVFDGIRASESGIRAKYLPVWFHPSFNCLSVSAIFYWSDEDVSSYIKKKNLPPGLSEELNTSGECWCGAYKTKQDFIRLYSLDKEIFHKLCDVEQSNKNGFTFIYERGKKVSLPELEKEILASVDLSIP